MNIWSQDTITTSFIVSFCLELTDIRLQSIIAGTHRGAYSGVRASSRALERLIFENSRPLRDRVLSHGDAAYSVFGGRRACACATIKST